MNDSSCFSTSSPALGIVSVLDFGGSNRCGEVCHCCFYLQFPNGIKCGASFHMLTCHLYIFFGKMSVQVFCPVFNRVVILLLNFKSSSIFRIDSPLSDRSLANIFPHLWLVFSFSWQCSVQSRNCLILMKSSLSVLSFMDPAFGILSKKSSRNPVSSRFSLVLSSRGFIDFHFTFMSMFYDYYYFR